MTVTSEGGEVTDALSGKLTFERNKNRIIGRDADNLARLLILADGIEFVMKVSAEGINVLNASDDDLIFNSNNNLFKIVDRGEVLISMPSITNGTQQIRTASASHSLGYSPLAIAFISYESPATPGSIITRVFGGASANAKSVSTTSVVIGYLSDESVEADVTQINFRWIISNATGITQPPIDATIKYYLLTETAS